MLTMPGASLEYQRCICAISAINAVIPFCGVEEGWPTSQLVHSRHEPMPDDDNSCHAAKRPRVQGPFTPALSTLTTATEYNRWATLGT